MPTIAQREYAVIAAVLLIFAAALVPSLIVARAEIRDSLRRQDITYLKRSLEQFYNEHEFYPALPDRDCITSREPSQWPFIETLPHDVREGKGFIYRFCITSTAAAGTNGYYLEAQLEVDQDDQRTFDEDELRKFYYRILHEGGKTLYRVCGGEAKQ